jgi:two-component system, cell cycle sensor histidine kinase PleC
MASASAAKATTRAETLWRRYGLAEESAAPHAASFPLSRTVLGMGALLVLAFVLSVAMLKASLEERLLAAAADDLEIFSRAIFRDLNEALASSKDLSTLAETLARVAPSSEAARGRRILVSDGRGRIAAVWPSLSSEDTTLQDMLRQDLLALQFADKAGVMRLDLADGSKALVALRNLPAPFGQAALIHPFEAALAPWRGLAWRLTALALAAAAGLLILLGVWRREAQRRNVADRGHHLVRRRLETALARARCGLWDWDIAQGRVYWSDSMYEMLGIEAAHHCLTIAELDALLHPDDGDLIHIAAKAAATQNRTIDHEFRIAGGDGGWVWLRARAELIEDARGGVRLVGIAIDISEQKALAEQTAAADLRLRDAIDAISEAFVLWDRQNRLVACNTKFLELHDLPSDAATPGASYRNIMEQAAPLAYVDDAAEESIGPAGEARSYKARLADGRWLQINERRTKDGGYVSVGADITTLKRNEETLRHSEHRLTGAVADLMQSRQTLETQKQQLAALAEQLHVQKSEAETANLSKTLFLANMSHELRTPLNAIIGFSEMMLEQTFGELGSPKYLEYCDDIKRSGAYLLEVFSAILDMSRLEAGGVSLQERDVDVERVLSDAIRHWRPRAQDKQIEISARAAPGLRCAGDHAAMVKTLGILLSNSIKFTPPGGAIRVRASRTGSSILIFVEDNGQGVERDALRRLCAPFMQSRAVIEDGMKGSGLGLAIARALMNLHKGSLRLRSRVGVGTIALLRLPAEAPGEPLMTQATRLREVGATMKAHASAPYARAVVAASFGAAAGRTRVTRSPG